MKRDCWLLISHYTAAAAAAAQKMARQSAIIFNLSLSVRYNNRAGGGVVRALSGTEREFYYENWGISSSSSRRGDINIDNTN
jgi:hypothetical protein